MDALVEAAVARALPTSTRSLTEEEIAELSNAEQLSGSKSILLECAKKSSGFRVADAICEHVYCTQSAGGTLIANPKIRKQILIDLSCGGKAISQCERCLRWCCFMHANPIPSIFIGSDIDKGHKWCADCIIEKLITIEELVKVDLNCKKGRAPDRETVNIIRACALTKYSAVRIRATLPQCVNKCGIPYSAIIVQRQRRIPVLSFHEKSLFERTFIILSLREIKGKIIAVHSTAEEKISRDEFKARSMYDSVVHKAEVFMEKALLGDQEFLDQVRLVKLVGKR